MVLKFVILISINFVYTSSISQTCIIGKISDNKIYVGADSRQTKFPFNNLTNKRDTTFLSVCKIFTTPTYSFAVAGFNPNLLTDSTFASIKKGGSLSEIGDRCQIAIVNILAKSISDERVSDPYFFSKMFSVHSIASGLFIFGYENGIAKILYIRFIVGENGIGTNQSFVNKQEAMGHTFEIQDLLPVKSTWNKGPVSGIKKLIAMQIEKHDTFVAHPIDIIKITSKRKRWVSKKQKCD